MNTEKTFKSMKVIVNDEFNRLVADEKLGTMHMVWSPEMKQFYLQLDKVYPRNPDGPKKVAQGNKTTMYFSRRANGGYGFTLSVNVPLFKAIGKEVIMQEFEHCLDGFFEDVNKPKSKK